MNLSEHFSLEELTASQTATRMGIDNKPTDAIMQSLTNLCDNLLEPIRAFINQVMMISSGFRCVELNRKIGGASTSQHVLGEAVDFTARGFSIEDLFKTIATGPFQYDQIIQEGNWVHASWTSRHKLRKQTLKAIFSPGGTTYQPYEFN